MPRLVARWNPNRDLWESDQMSLFSELSDVFSETWPISGMTRGGVAYELPMSVPRTVVSGFSSSRGRLMPTPEAKLSDSGPDFARAGREGSGGDDLTTAVVRMSTDRPR